LLFTVSAYFFLLLQMRLKLKSIVTERRFKKKKKIKKKR